MSHFFQALDQGYSPEDILGYLSKAIPKISPMIRKAQRAGYPTKQILGFLSKSFETENRTGLSESERHAVNKRADSERAKYGLKLAGSAIATPLALQAAQGALARALPQSLTQGAGLLNIGNDNSAQPLRQQQPLQPQTTEMQPTTQQLQNTSSQPPISPNIPQQTISAQPQIKPINFSELLNKHQGFESKINDLMKSGNTPEAIALYFKKFNPSQTAKVEKESGKKIDELITEYVSQNRIEQKEAMSREEALGAFRDKKMIRQAQEEENANVKPLDIQPGEKDIGFKAAFKTLEGGTATNKLYEGIFDSLQKGKDTFAGIRDPLIAKAKPYFDKGLIKSPDDIKRLVNNPEEFEKKETPKIEKGSTVAAPQGIGEIKEIRNGKAIVEVDGKKHQVNEDELIQSPIREKDLADLYDDLINGIEKTTGKQVSRNVDWAGYDPNTNELAYKPHGSDKLYAYEDIDPEDVEILTNLLTQRKSTGENFIGAWQAGTESPIGAAMYQLIKKLQASRGGKGSEYKNKFETIYDALEPAKKAAKERHAERKKKAKKPRLD